MPNLGTCNKKNCGCSSVHNFEDELTVLSKYSLKQAYSEFEKQQDGLEKKIISLEEYRRKPFVHLHTHTFHSIKD